MYTLTPKLDPTEPTTRSVKLTRGCLALNASFEPLEVLAQERAIRLVLEGRAEIVEADPNTVIHSGSGAEIMAAPLVIRLVRYVHVPRKLRRGVSNTFLFARDGYRCGYCGRHRRELRSREFLTRDHIKPQVEFRKNGGDPNSWENCVTACNTCNNKKGDLSLAQSGLTLRVVPTEPHFVRLEWAVRRLTPLQRKYIAMFYGDEALSQAEEQLG